MKKLFLISGGRNGSIFFQSILDGHPQILQFPGIFKLDKFLRNLNSSYTTNSFLDLFVTQFSWFFDSRKKPLYGMDRLGDSQDEFFCVSVDTFKQAFKDLCTQSNQVSMQAMITNLHVAYHIARVGEYPQEAKFNLIHIHNVKRLKYVLNIIPELDFFSIFMDRDILPSLSSELDGWHNYDIHSDRPKLSKCRYVSAVNRKILEPYRLRSIDPYSITIKLEDLHRSHKALLTNFCSKIGISYHQSLSMSTFNSLKWWGDSVSKKPVNGFNPNFTNKFNSSSFYNWEISLLLKATAPRAKAYGYSSLSKSKFIKYAFLLPGKLEVDAWKSIFSSIIYGPFDEKKSAIRQIKAYFTSSNQFMLKIEIIKNINPTLPLPRLFSPVSPPHTSAN